MLDQFSPQLVATIAIAISLIVGVLVGIIIGRFTKKNKYEMQLIGQLNDKIEIHRQEYKKLKDKYLLMKESVQ